MEKTGESKSPLQVSVVKLVTSSTPHGFYYVFFLVVYLGALLRGNVELQINNNIMDLGTSSGENTNLSA